MACGTASAPIDYWTSWQFVDGVVCFYGDAMGLLPFFLAFFGIMMFGLYHSTGSMMVPIVLLIALGPMLLFLIPAVGIQVVVLVSVLGLGVGGYWLWSRLR